MEPRVLRRADPLSFALSLIVRPRADDHARRVAARDDRHVGPAMGRLPHGWHAIERPTSHDHVVVGPAGVFTLTVKDLTGKVWVAGRSIRHDGHPTDFVSSAAREATQTARALSATVGRPVEVRAVLAILADEWTIKEASTDVYVASPRGVRDWLLRQPATLSDAEVDQIARAASAERVTAPL